MPDTTLNASHKACPYYGERCGKDAERVFATSLWEPRADYPGARKFERDFIATYGEAPGYHAGLAYAAGQVLNETIKEAGSVDRERVRTLLFRLDTMTVIGRFGVDQTGKQVRQQAFIIQWQTNIEHSQAIEEYVNRAAELTRQLLDFARGGKYDIKPADINAVLDNSAQMFGRTKKEISIHADVAPDLRPVEVDRRQIEQVFLNLFVNAWHAMPGRGKLIITTANVFICLPASDKENRSLSAALEMMNR